MDGLPVVCPRCRDVIALHDGKPIVSASGDVTLWHASCWDEEDIEITVLDPAPPLVIARSRTRRRFMVASATLALVGGALGGWFYRSAETLQVAPASVAINTAPAPESIVLAAQLTTREASPPALDPLEVYSIPEKRGKPITETYPTLLTWIHPVVKPALILPELPTGHFGAERKGVMRRECRHGHCGADIAGPIGKPIVAVADGVVIHVDRTRNGKDGRSGRYVRIEHEDGSVTAYMHLNSVAGRIDRGDKVFAGQQIGTLGRTGIRSAQPHLHFALELPNTPGAKGDGKNTHYVNPAAFLVRATVIETADRRRGKKPAT